MSSTTPTVSASTTGVSTTSLNSPPRDFVCPISMTLMDNPVRSKKTNQCFEREAIMNWIYRGNIVCPLTRTPLHPDDLELDTELQAKILKWKISQEFQESGDGLGLDDSDGDFDATFQDILEITNKIKTITVGGRRQSAPASVIRSTPVVEEDAPAKRASTGARRLSDLRSKVLQQREERIQSMLSKGKEASSDSPTSLATMMTTRAS